MSSNSDVINQVPYIQTSRNFPEQARQLTVEITRAYIDIAIAVNKRTIGIFPTSKPAITGESWFVDDNRQRQTLREVYTFLAIAPGGSLSIRHNISTGTYEFTRIYGTCKTALPDNRPIPYASIAANSNIDLRVDATNIIISNGAAAPAIVSGIIVLEWMSQF
jgi:hypothetical protein